MRQFIKFGLVGCLNTGITYGVFILLFRVLRINEYLANTTGYIAGLVNSFLWNKLWTFRSRSVKINELVLFAAVFGVSFGIQMVLFHILIKAGIRKETAELPAMICYTLINFTGNKFLTFRKRGIPESGKPQS